MVRRQHGLRDYCWQGSQGSLEAVVSYLGIASLVIPITVLFERLSLRVYHSENGFNYALLQILVLNSHFIDLTIIIVPRVLIN